MCKILQHFKNTLRWNIIIINQFALHADVLKEILREIDSKLSEEDLDGIIEEVDEDGSGTLDFDGNENETYTHTCLFNI